MSFDEKVRKITGAPEPSAPTPSSNAQAVSAGLPAELAWFARKAGVKIVLPQGSDEAKPPSKGLGVVLIGAMAAVVLLLAGGLAWALRSAATPAAGAASDSMAMATSPDMPAAAAALPAADAAGNYAQTASPATAVAPATDAAAPVADSAPVTGDTPYLETQKAAAEAALAQQMSEPRGLVFRDVTTVVASSNGVRSVNFCGDVNSRNPMGEYIGYQRFISSADHAQIEQFMTPGEFSQAWHDRCSGDQGPQIWK